MFGLKKKKEVFKTGFEGKKTAELQTVNCPVCAGPVKISICHGTSQEAQCNYYSGHELLARGKGKKPKMMIICKAPQSLRVNEIIIKLEV